MEMQAGKVLKFCKQTLMGILVRGEKTRILMRIQTVKGWFIRFQLEMKTVLETELEPITVSFLLRTYLYFVLTLFEAKFKGSGLIVLVQEVSRQPIVQAVS